MWQFQKLSTLLALGLVAISTSAGCATSVEDPVEDEMTTDNAAESSEALTAGGGGVWGGGFRGGFVGPRGLAWGTRFRG